MLTKINLLEEILNVQTTLVQFFKLHYIQKNHLVK